MPLSVFVPDSVSEASRPMKSVLCPVARYNERVHRARRANNNIALKITGSRRSCSPAPRSATKERPVKEISQKKAVAQNDENEGVNSPGVPSFSRNPFLMADGCSAISNGVKKNPFLLADKKAKKAPPPPRPVREGIEGWARPAPALEPRPIGHLSDQQRAVLQRKRECVQIEKRRASVGPGCLVQPAEPELVGEGYDFEEELFSAYTDLEQETGVPVAPAPAPEVQPASTAEPEAFAAAPIATPPAARAPAPLARREPQGDMAALLQARAGNDLLAAVSAMLPNLDAELRKARAVEQTSESLLEVVRRAHAGKKQRRR